jgi:hypothetical protein
VSLGGLCHHAAARAQGVRATVVALAEADPPVLTSAVLHAAGRHQARSCGVRDPQSELADRVHACLSWNLAVALQHARTRTLLGPRRSLGGIARWQAIAEACVWDPPDHLRSDRPARRHHALTAIDLIGGHLSLRAP